MFASTSKATILYYQNQLQNLKKEGQSMSEYLLKYKNLIDTLSYVGHIMIEQDQILQILNGLGQEYSWFMMTIIAQLGLYSIEEIASFVNDCEEKS